MRLTLSPRCSLTHPQAEQSIKVIAPTSRKAHHHETHLPDDLTQAADARDCKHCKRKIVLFNSAFGELWVGARAVASCDKSPDTFHKPTTD